MYIGLLTSLLLAYLVSGVHAFQIHGYPTYYERVDPIVSAGAVSSHVHAITAPTNFGPNATTSLLASSKCGTMETQQDMSAYWVPAFYGQNRNGTFSALPYKGLSVYYLKNGNGNFSRFPDNFRMVVGSPMATEKNWHDPFISYECQNFIPEGDIWGQLNFTEGYETLPEKPCTNIKVAISAPMCNDGRYDSPNHRDHMNYTNNGDCPSSHPHLLPQLTIEFTFSTEGYGPSEVFLSTGDNVGWSAHVDYLFGWKNNGDLIFKALEEDTTCQSSQGILSIFTKDRQCATLLPYSDVDAMHACHAELTAEIPQEAVGIDSPIPALPGCNPLYGRGNLPPVKPHCDSTTSPAIGNPTRLFPWPDRPVTERSVVMLEMPVFDPSGQLQNAPSCEHS